MTPSDRVSPAEAVAIAFRAVEKLAREQGEASSSDSISVEQKPDDACVYVTQDGSRNAKFRLCPAGSSMWNVQIPLTRACSMPSGGSGYFSTDVSVDAHDGASSNEDAAPTNGGDAQDASVPTTSCDDPDKSNLHAGSVTFIGRNTSTHKPGEVVTVYDTCKGGGLLIEQTCEGYHGPDTLPSELKPELWECECVEGACVDGTVKICADPEMKHYDGKSVWSDNKNGVTKRYYSDCADQLSIRYVYCNPNGSFHADSFACGFNELCADGMCGGFQCVDDKPAGVDPKSHQPPGTLTFTNPTTGATKTFTDYCIGGTGGGIMQLQCPIATTTDFNELNHLVNNEWLYKVPCTDGEWCTWETALCAPGTPAGSSPFVCSNDTDIANDPHVAGTVSAFDPETGKTYTQYDSCYAVESDDLKTVESKLSQVSCDPVTGEVLYESTSCPPGEQCLPKEGVCAPATCEISCNSEKGLDLFTKGGIDVHTSCGGEKFGTFSYYSDTCTWYPATTMIEYECVNGVPKKEAVTCPPDYYCYSQDSIGGPGACVQCTDTDKPNNPGVAGMVIDVKGQQGADFCTTDGKLKQSSCNENGKLTWSDPLPCPPGQSCQSGACH